jgi:hypothetical protein
MMRLKLYLTGLALLEVVACQSTESQLPDTSVPPGPGASTEAVVAPGNNLDLNQALVRRGYRDHRTIAQDDEFLAVVAEHVSAGRTLLLLRVSGDSLIEIHSPWTLGEYDPSLVRWLRLFGEDVDGVIITFDYPEVAEVGSVVFSVRSGQLVRTFVDASSTCRPAEIRDIDHDGQLELLSYVDDPAGGDCATECHVVLKERFSVVPAWTQVYQWTGATWEITERNYSSFYDQLGETYQKIAQWLERPESRVCQEAYWMKNRSLFHDWATRARSIAQEGVVPLRP